MTTCRYFPTHGVVLHFAPKCASSSIGKAIASVPHVPVDVDTDYMVPVKHFMAVRHPADRLMSAWSYFCKTDNNQLEQAKHQQALGYHKDMPFTEFLDIVLKDPSQDIHAEPQIVYAGRKINWAHPDNCLVTLDRIDDMWQEVMSLVPGVEPLERSNESDREGRRGMMSFMRVRTPLMNLIEGVYAHDLALYETARVLCRYR